MEQITAIADQFFALPYISSFFQSNAMLRVAANSYGTPLFLIFCALIFLVVLLLISKLMPKKGRPKPIKEDKPKKTPRKLRRSRGEKSRQAHPRPSCVSWKNCPKANCRSTPWQTRKDAALLKTLMMRSKWINPRQLLPR